ncbi:olfactory receptor 6Q1-like [Hyla sarda]|uniref:olfactory receptor 6Q1-like n=1 Tax=Hyla sarda TaxID=327740 RepID=UPI0024C3F630|nr:olfactory receptor 6Q1-like [Hyla sarda]
MSNSTRISTFLLAGLSSCSHCQNAIFTLFLLVYVFTLLENLAIIALILRDPKLWKPMYIFVGNLSFLEVWYISITLPNVLANIMTGNREISYAGCITQLFTFTFLGATECYLLATMAYDRYVAICYPLRYTVLMQDKYVLSLLIVSWLTGFATPILPIWFLIQLNFCGTNEIDHYFCDVSPLLKLACGNIKLKEIVDLIVSVFVLVSSMLVIFISYICIAWAILKMPSSKVRYKAFSTCASHLAVVCVYYGSMSFTYIRVDSASPGSTNKLVSVLYSVITPMLNPLIYTLRNKDVRQAIQKNFSKPKGSKLGL